MRKPKTGSVRIPSPFTTIHKTEWTGAAKLAEEMNNIIKRKGLPLGQAEVETTQEGNRKRVDIILFESPTSQNAICVIETKQPYYDAFDEEELKEPARKKATQRSAKYFATSNFQHLYWFDTQKVNSLRPLEEQIQDKYFLSQIENLDLIEEPRYKNSILSGLERFLTDLYEVHSGKKVKPKLAIDDLLVYRIHDKIIRLARQYTRIIEDKCHKDAAFNSQLGKWFNDQGWSFVWQPQDFDKTARQTAYLLANKILFYEALQAKRPQKLDSLQISEGLTKGAQLQKILQSFFDEVLKIDYETIYTTDFIDTIAFPEVKEVVKEIRELVDILRQYDFSKLGYDIIGKIFEKLIPQEERHDLGQYFTNPDVVDIIIEFCLQGKAAKAKVFDPACGAGTFLVRAYQHKRLLNQLSKHEDILDTLWGNDIAKFPAHLSTINLAINDLAADRNYPNILQEDFFNLLSTEGGFELPRKWRRARASTLGKKEREIEYPRWFDCVVGNPPYTRQEEISDIAPKDKGYKASLIDNALFDSKDRQLAEISKRAGIYAYFFVHGTKFLQNGGRFGFVVSNSWLDVDYGKGLQEFFLKNYKIIAIIESKVERWFEDADINTCIIILEKCSGEDKRRERNENIVRFAYLKKPLRYFIPSAQDMWERQVERRNAIKDKFIKTILAHNELYDDEDFRIYPKKQSELWEEGFDLEKNEYVGSKWGKYLRAPDIFFKILEKGKDKLVPLKQIADVRFGIKTGANEFFYLTEDEIKRHGIEREFWMHQDDNGNWIPNYVIKSPRECKSIIVKPEDLKYRVLMIHKDKKDLRGTNVLKYIREGETKGYHNRDTCSSRQRWYDLGKRQPGTLLVAMIQAYRHIVFHNPFKVYPDHNLFEILLDEAESTLCAAALSSAVTMLTKEFYGRSYGGGSGPLKLEGIDIEKLPIIAPSKATDEQRKIAIIKLKKLSASTLHDTFNELGAFSPEQVSLDKVKPDRRELDKIIMGEILGLTDDEQLEVYRAVIDLVKSRLEKAKSFGKRKKTREGIDVDLLVKTVMEKVGDDTLGKFHREKVLSQKQLYTKALPKAGDEIAVRQSLLGWRLYSGKEYIDCASEFEARYLRVWLQAGMVEVKVPKDEGYLETIVPELESLKAKIDDAIEAHLSFIANPRTRDRILHRLWQEITK
ncbi:MAG: SAM-dependent DNA methyltransferase [Chloroflexi bacterium]|nr:SAM-dependent DNA methyltransferase [Chloroflexota bacterium]